MSTPTWWGPWFTNPMKRTPRSRFRGASRYIADSFPPCFALRCEAMKRVQGCHGLTNVEVMIPFVRTLGEAEQVVEILAGTACAVASAA